MLFRKREHRWYFVKSLSSFIGLIMIWRGLWYILDGIDQWIFGGVHTWTAIGGVIAGLIFIYWPEKNLKEIERL